MLKFKLILAYEGISFPDFAVFSESTGFEKGGKLRMPLFVKPLRADASIGIDRKSLVDNPTGPFRLRKLLQGVTGYDIILLDTPPHLGFALNSALLTAHVALLPTLLVQEGGYNIRSLGRNAAQILTGVCAGALSRRARKRT